MLDCATILLEASWLSVHRSSEVCRSIYIPVVTVSKKPHS